MPKLTFSYDDKGNVIIVDNKTQKAEKIGLLDVMSGEDSVRAIQKATQADYNASAGALSLLADRILCSPRLDAYKGKTPHNEAVPSELRGAIRELETEQIKPLFLQTLKKGQSEAEQGKAWDLWRNANLNTGSYANAKSTATKAFAHLGILPKTESGKLLPANVLVKMIASAKETNPDPDANSIASKLVALSLDLEQRTEKTKLGNIGAAIAALNSLLSTYKGLEREETERKAEQLMRAHEQGQSAIAAAQATIAAAQSQIVLTNEQKAAIEVKLDADYMADKITAEEYTQKMLEIGIEVELTETAD